MTDDVPLSEYFFQEGAFPVDSTLTVSVASAGSAWHQLFTAVIQDLIHNNTDLYLRGSDLGASRGFAYVSESYNLHGEFTKR